MPQAEYPIVTRTARADIRGTLTGGFSTVSGQWSVYVQAPVSEDWSLAAMAELAAELQDWFDDDYQPICSNQATLSQIEVTSLSVVNGGSVLTTPNITGTLASELALSVGAPVIQCFTESGAVVPRTYFNVWGMAESQSHGNTLESAYQTALGVATELLRTRIEAFAASSWDPGLTAQPVAISVHNPGWKTGDPPDERYRDLGLTAQIIGMSPRQLIGRRVSRQT